MNKMELLLVLLDLSAVFHMLKMDSFEQEKYILGGIYGQIRIEPVESLILKNGQFGFITFSYNIFWEYELSHF